MSLIGRNSLVTDPPSPGEKKEKDIESNSSSLSLLSKTFNLVNNNEKKSFSNPFTLMQSLEPMARNTLHKSLNSGTSKKNQKVSSRHYNSVLQNSL